MTDNDRRDLVPTTGDQLRITGRFTNDPATAERDAQAADLRSRGMTYRAIGEQLGVHWSTAADMVERAMATVRREKGAAAIELELAKYDSWEQAVNRVLDATHYTVSNGKLIYLGEEPLLDDAPVLAAVDRLVRIAERRARLLGLDSPTKVDTTAQVKFVVEGVPVDDV